MDKQKDYQKIKEFHVILFINQEDEENLIKHGVIRYEEGGEINNCIMHLHLVNLKNINRVAKERKFSKFEAVIYFMANNTLEGIGVGRKKH